MQLQTQLIHVFNGLFAQTYNTRLVCALADGRMGAQDEPVYEPANSQRSYHQVVFAHGYFASALHEMAHWCVAGTERRLLLDFGYWYRPDGRTPSQQAEFEQAEVKPQALEWLFSMACGRVFIASADNLSGEASDDLAFRLAVSAQARSYVEQGLPIRAAQLVVQLTTVFGGQVDIEQLYWPEEI
jgi:hypothetical protein